MATDNLGNNKAVFDAILADYNNLWPAVLKDAAKTAKEEILKQYELGKQGNLWAPKVDGSPSTLYKDGFLEEGIKNCDKNAEIKILPDGQSSIELKIEGPAEEYAGFINDGINETGKYMPPRPFFEISDSMEEAIKTKIDAKLDYWAKNVKGK